VWLEVELFKEYIGTCKEYIDYVKKPFSDVPIKSLWKCDQSDWEKAFKEWSLMNFYVGIAVHILANLFYIIGWGFDGFVGAIINIIYNIFFTYFFSHMAWFGVVKKGGFCCWCIVCLSEAPILNLLWGIWLCFYGFWMILSGLQWLGLMSDCFFCLFSAILYIVYAVVWFYMGVCCIRIWMAKGSQIMPANLAVKGPDGVVPTQAGKPAAEEMA